MRLRIKLEDLPGLIAQVLNIRINYPPVMNLVTHSITKILTVLNTKKAKELSLHIYIDMFVSIRI